MVHVAGRQGGAGGARPAQQAPQWLGVSLLGPRNGEVAPDELQWQQDRAAACASQVAFPRAAQLRCSAQVIAAHGQPVLAWLRTAATRHPKHALF